MGISTGSTLLDMNEFPFYAGMLDRDVEPGWPKSMPFRLYVDEQLVLPRLSRTPEIEDGLRAAYAHGSMLSTPLGESTLATDRMEEVLVSLLERSGGRLSGKRYVEVGSGNGALLNAVRRHGAEVMGFEIGPQAEVARQLFGLNIIRDELTSKHLPGDVDCIYSYGCLEHVYEPSHFIDTARGALVPGGLFFHSVPNSSLLFDTGDIQGLCHEHVNYFTIDNAIRLLSARGFSNCGASLTKAGNELNMWGYADPNAKLCWPADDTGAFETECDMVREYGKCATDRTRRQIHQLKAMHDGLPENRLGCYAGGHILASIAGIAAALRFFDGDAGKWGKCWLEGLRPVEPPASLLMDPVDILVVFAEHHFEPICEYLRHAVGVPESTAIIPLSKI